MDKSDILALSFVPLVLLAVAAFMYIKMASLTSDQTSDKLQISHCEKLANAIEDGSILSNKTKLAQLLRTAVESASTAQSAYEHLIATLKSLSGVMASLGILQLSLLFAIFKKQHRNLNEGI